MYRMSFLKCNREKRKYTIYETFYLHDSNSQKIKNVPQNEDQLFLFSGVNLSLLRYLRRFHMSPCTIPKKLSIIGSIMLFFDNYTSVNASENFFGTFRYARDVNNAQQQRNGVRVPKPCLLAISLVPSHPELKPRVKTLKRYAYLGPVSSFCLESK